MCESTTDLPLPDPDAGRTAGPTRRGVLRAGVGAVAAAALMPSVARWTSGTPAWADTAADGSLVVPMAMHVHGSFSEGAGSVGASWQTQLEEARLAGVTVLWPTDHDWRMSAFQAPDVFHTAALTETVQSRSYTWRKQTSGSLTHEVAAAVTRPSPADPATKKGALRLEATSAGDAAASTRLYLDAGAGNHAHRTNVTGQVLRVQVLPLTTSSDAWGELLITLSHHPATGGRPAGSYQLSYRFGATGGRSTQGLLAVVPVAVKHGVWNEATLDLTGDIARAWPDLVAEDNALVDLWLGATSRAASPASCLFAYLRFAHDAAGDRPLQVQSSVFDAYASRYTGIDVRPGVEVSVIEAHINGFGGQRHLPDYTRGDAGAQVDADPASYTAWSARLIHGWGGLASLNHPFGSTAGTISQAQQDSHRRQIAQRLLDARAYGLDVLEVGYRQRGGATLDTHLQLWDTMSRSGVWLTGNGVNDAHGGNQNDWRKLSNRFVTTVLARSTAEADLLAALAAGRAYCCELGSFAGLLDLRAGLCRTGQVSVQPGVARRALTITATQLPGAATVRVVQGPVDYAKALDPSTRVVTQLGASAFRTGSATVQIDTSTSTFVRVEVVSNDRVVAFTNPVWLLQEQPPVAPVAARVSADSA